MAILTSYKKLSVGYFELKLHIHTLRISETYFTSCKKEHNMSPTKHLSPLPVFNVGVLFFFVFMASAINPLGSEGVWGHWRSFDMHLGFFSYTNING